MMYAIRHELEAGKRGKEKLSFAYKVVLLVRYGELLVST